MFLGLLNFQEKLAPSIQYVIYEISLRKQYHY